MKTWSEADNQLLPRIRYARQNGVPLVEFDDAARATVPGRLVARWGPGNWSGSEDSKLRTMRSGVALQQNGGKRFLIYADFSDATPSAMARIFQAYQCRYAMLLDMNALEHTYCAVYRRTGSRLAVQHLIKGMSELDKSAPSGEVLPRFLGSRRQSRLLLRHPACTPGGEAMRVLRLVALGLLAYCGLIAFSQSPAFQEQNEFLLRQLQAVHRLTGAQMSAIREIFAKSGYIGQGNPAVTRHPVTPEQCQAKLKQSSIDYDNPRFEKICGAKYMAPLYDPATQKPEDAKVCIDQFEFPDIPCAYPVVWVKAREAAEICSAMGKRLCDAHEWEGACAGSLQPPDYRLDLAKGLSPNAAVERMRAAAQPSSTAATRPGATALNTRKESAPRPVRRLPDATEEAGPSAAPTLFPTAISPRAAARWTSTI